MERPKMLKSLKFILVAGLISGCGTSESNNQKSYTNSLNSSGGSISICTANLPKSKQYFITPIPYYFVNNEKVGSIMMASESMRFRGEKYLTINVNVGDQFELKAPKSFWNAQPEDLIYAQFNVESKKDRYVLVAPESNFTAALSRAVTQTGNVLAMTLVDSLDGLNSSKRGVPYEVTFVTKKLFKSECK
jgi:hypothetical protein